jgi:hypothetical protein
MIAARSGSLAGAGEQSDHTGTRATEIHASGLHLHEFMTLFQTKPDDNSG